MKVFLVGGAIRDDLLGLPFEEKDWVVVNSSHQEMIKKGFKQVGKNFPVYLHPKTKEEYALARKEIKTGKGHKNFAFDTNIKISLREDLKRRDITINAIAKDKSGNFFDPYKGIEDIKNRKIRIVSKAFSEDPLRLFRVARFKTKLANFNFSLTADTLKTLKKMSSEKEIDFLSGERIWDETKKALSYENSSIYFSTLKRVDALKYFEGLDAVYSKNLRYLKRLDTKSNMISEKWAIINLSSKDADILEKKIKVPKKITNFRKTVNGIFQLSKQNKLDGEKIISTLNSMNLFRNDIYLIESLNLLEEAKIINDKKAKNWKALINKLKKVKIKSNDLSPNDIKEKLLQKRLKIITNHKNVL